MRPGVPREFGVERIVDREGDSGDQQLSRAGASALASEAESGLAANDLKRPMGGGTEPPLDGTLMQRARDMDSHVIPQPAKVVEHCGERRTASFGGRAR